MIVFDLSCHCGYVFEGWFHDHPEYERQESEGLLCCPQCGDRRVRKILSPVATLGRQRQEPAPSPDRTRTDEMVSRLRACLTELKTYLYRNFEDVGVNLASTALKIHYGVEESRNIRGVATAEEERVLKQEGIELLTVPVLNDDDDGQ